MTLDSSWLEQPPAPPGDGINPEMPSIARVYDFWLGGKDNFPADRQAARLALKAFAGLREGVLAQRQFLQRAVRYLAGEAGIRQFLDIGTGIPAANNTHEVAQAVAPGARVVYVDNDPVVLAHAHALLGGGAGPTSFLDADLRDTGTILADAERLLDFTQPVAVLLIGILQLIPDTDDPAAIVGRLVAAVPPGSWLVIVQPTQDVCARQMSQVETRMNHNLPHQPTTMRSHDAILRFFTGTNLIPPGLVQVHRWQPGPDATGLDRDIPAYGGVAYKP